MAKKKALWTEDRDRALFEVVGKMMSEDENIYPSTLTEKLQDHPAFAGESDRLTGSKVRDRYNRLHKMPGSRLPEMSRDRYVPPIDELNDLLPGE